MSAPSSERADAQHELDEIIARYLREIDEGAFPDRRAYLLRHPDLADQLELYFAAQDDLDRLAAPIRVAIAPVPLGLDDVKCG